MLLIDWVSAHGRTDEGLIDSTFDLSAQPRERRVVAELPQVIVETTTREPGIAGERSLAGTLEQHDLLCGMVFTDRRRLRHPR
ncbi:MAG: hypothetical protein IAG13_31775, partial [Deltaproteobacteria bacterium]|nr:hypothetical protein [Nannocystaceae bacterium]